MFIGHFATAFAAKGLEPQPSLATYLSGPLLGLGLWNSIAATFAVEGALFAVGVGLYLRATKAIDHIGRWSLWGFLACLLLTYLAGPFSPPQPSPTVVIIVDALLAALLPWAAWFDRHRSQSEASVRASGT